MSTMSAKHKELSEQLGTWWRTQTDFKTKKDLAGLLRVHSDTLGEYFSGRSFPRWDIACRLFELTDIECLRPDVGGNSSLEMFQGSPPPRCCLHIPLVSLLQIKSIQKRIITVPLDLPKKRAI